MSVVRNNLVPTRPYVRYMATKKDFNMLQICRSRPIESMLVPRNKYVSFVQISNSPQTNIHYLKDSLEQAAEFLNDISMASWAIRWEEVFILYPQLLFPGRCSPFTDVPFLKFHL